MSNYEKQGFVSGQILTAAHLNHMESYLHFIDPILEVIEEADYTNTNIVNFIKNTEPNGTPYQFKEIIITATGTFGATLPTSMTIGAKLEPDINIYYETTPREIPEHLKEQNFIVTSRFFQRNGRWYSEGTQISNGYNLLPTPLYTNNYLFNNWEVKDYPFILGARVTFISSESPMNCHIKIEGVRA